MASSAAAAPERQLDMEEYSDLQDRLLWEGRKFDKDLLRVLVEEGQPSLEVLKSFAKSLKNRLDAVKAVITPDAKMSLAQRMVSRVISNPSREDLLHVIQEMDEELSKLETSLTNRSNKVDGNGSPPPPVAEIVVLDTNSDEPSSHDATAKSNRNPSSSLGADHDRSVEDVDTASPRGGGKPQSGEAQSKPQSVSENQDVVDSTEDSNPQAIEAHHSKPKSEKEDQNNVVVADTARECLSHQQRQEPQPQRRKENFGNTKRGEEEDRKRQANPVPPPTTTSPRDSKRRKMVARKTVVQQPWVVPAAAPRSSGGLMSPETRRRDGERKEWQGPLEHKRNSSSAAAQNKQPDKVSSKLSTGAATTEEVQSSHKKTATSTQRASKVRKQSSEVMVDLTGDDSEEELEAPVTTSKPMPGQGDCVDEKAGGGDRSSTRNPKTDTSMEESGDNIKEEPNNPTTQSVQAYVEPELAGMTSGGRPTREAEQSSGTTSSKSATSHAKTSAKESTARHSSHQEPTRRLSQESRSGERKSQGKSLSIGGTQANDARISDDIRSNCDAHLHDAARREKGDDSSTAQTELSTADDSTNDAGDKEEVKTKENNAGKEVKKVKVKTEKEMREKMKEKREDVKDVYGKYGDRYLLARQHPLGIARLGGSHQETHPHPKLWHKNIWDEQHRKRNDYPFPSQLEELNDKEPVDMAHFQYMAYNVLWNPKAPRYAGQPSASVSFVPRHFERSRHAFPVFVNRLRMKKKDKSSSPPLLGWEYCGNYQVVADREECSCFWESAENFPHASKVYIPRKLLQSAKSENGYGRYTLNKWRAKLRKALENDDSPAAPAFLIEDREPTDAERYEIRPSLAARARARDFNPETSDNEALAHLLVRLDEYHEQVAIQFVEYDERIYEYCKEGKTNHDREGKMVEYTKEPAARAGDWYDWAEMNMLMH